jgi:hypothetical protein
MDIQEIQYASLMERQMVGEWEITTYTLRLPRGVRTPETVKSGGLTLTKVVKGGDTKECSTHSGER